MSIKSKLEKLEGKMRKSSNYAEIIKRHSIPTRKDCGPDESITVHTIMALYINSYPEHKGAIKARNYLEWTNKQSFNAILRAYAAIKDLIDAGLATFTPTEFISDGRDVSGFTPPYQYLCNLDQILHSSSFGDTRFWTDLK